MKTAKVLSRILTVAIFSAFVVSCTKTDIRHDNLKPESFEILEGKNTTPLVAVKFLGHRGAGSNNYNDVNMENSIPSVIEALRINEGVEVDMQMSLDGTIWLFHDADINRTLCTPGAARSILNMRDVEIAQLKLCSRTKTGRVYKLAELINLWNQYPNGFYISMHIKDDFTTTFYNTIGGRTAYLTKFANQLAKDIELSTLKHSASQFLVEQEDLILPNALRKYPVGNQVKYYLFNYRSFDAMVTDALRMGYDGVSCNFTDKTLSATKIRSAHLKGLSIMVWTPYTDKEVQKVYDMNPDFIQTDQTNVKADINL